MPSNGSATVTKTPKNKSPPPAKQDANPKHDFFWTYTEEPHRTRRLAIIKAHPEVWPTPREPSKKKKGTVTENDPPDYKTMWP